MIPGLLHGRTLGGAPAGGVIASPAYQKLLAFATGSSSSQAMAVFTINSVGSWAGSGTGYTGKSGSWFSPLTAGAGDAYEVRITPTKTAGVAGVVTNHAAGWVALSAARSLSIMVQRFTDGTTIAYYSVKVEIRLVGGAIVSTGTFEVTCTAEVRAASGGGGGSVPGGCPALGMWLGAGLLAGEVAAGQKIDGVVADDPDTLARLPVLSDQITLQPCYRIVTSNGAACVLSDSTPFTLRDGTSRLVAGMLGQQVLRDDGQGDLVWDVVMACYPVGMLDVIRISVGGHSLLAGENPLMRIVSHNESKA